MAQQMATIELETSDFSLVSFPHQNKYCRELHSIYPPVRQPLRRMNVLPLPPFSPSLQYRISGATRRNTRMALKNRVRVSSSTRPSSTFGQRETSMAGFYGPMLKG